MRIDRRECAAQRRNDQIQLIDRRPREQRSRGAGPRTGRQRKPRTTMQKSPRQRRARANLVGLRRVALLALATRRAKEQPTWRAFRWDTPVARAGERHERASESPGRTSAVATHARAARAAARARQVEARLTGTTSAGSRPSLMAAEWRRGPVVSRSRQSCGRLPWRAGAGAPAAGWGAAPPRAVGLVTARQGVDLASGGAPERGARAGGRQGPRERAGAPRAGRGDGCRGIASGSGRRPAAPSVAEVVSALRRPGGSVQQSTPAHVSRRPSCAGSSR